MSDCAETTIHFTTGRYSTVDHATWEEPSNAPTATISLTVFCAIFDAIGEETIDVSGDIDPGVLLGLVGLGPRGYEEPIAWLRLVCTWARRRSLRVGFEPVEASDSLTNGCTAE